MKITWLLLFISLGLYGQPSALPLSPKRDSSHFSRKMIIPVALMVTGIMTSNSPFEKSLHTDIRNAVGNDFDLGIDDYFQYAPIAEMYLADIWGAKSKNHWFDQTKNLLLADLITGTLVFSIKKITAKRRPNGADLSFPSGHTTFAFANAGVLYHEFKDNHPILAYSGFAFSTTTGLFRMLNDKHWLSDVLFGAGLGLCIPILIYHFEPLKNWNPFHKKVNLILQSKIKNKGYEFYLCYQF